MTWPPSLAQLAPTTIMPFSSAGFMRFSRPLVLVLSISKDLSRQPPEVLRRVQRVCKVWRCMEKLQ
jgi:hypothetical protein